MALIYKIANDKNNKCYIGQTRNSLQKRLIKHLSDVRKNSNLLIHKAIRKYGWNHFSVEVLEDNIPLENLNEKELYYTEKYNALAPNGYVLIAGGEPRIVSKETCKKLSKNHADFSGKNHPLYGKHHTKESKRKMSSSAKKGMEHKDSRPILCYDLDGNFIKEYSFIREASKELNLHEQNISQVCKRLRKRTGNYKFKYK